MQAQPAPIKPTREIRALSRHHTASLRSIAEYPNTRWLWLTRSMPQSERVHVDLTSQRPPQSGDLVLAQVVQENHHKRIYTRDMERLRIRAQDYCVGVMGHRYATDIYEAEARSLDQLALLTTGGLIGNVLSKHRDVRTATRFKAIGYLCDQDRQPLRLQVSVRAHLRKDFQPQIPFYLVVGSGMNAGKTTTMANITRNLTQKGLRVASMKVTGSASHHDQYEYKSAGAAFIRDFSDYGYPSTYLNDIDQLEDLYAQMLSDAHQEGCDVALMELADGVLQAETEKLLACQLTRKHCRGVILAASCSSSALLGAQMLDHHQLKTLAVTGLVTNSPLYCREFSERHSVKILDESNEKSGISDLICSTFP